MLGYEGLSEDSSNSSIGNLSSEKDNKGGTFIAAPSVDVSMIGSAQVPNDIYRTLLRLIKKRPEPDDLGAVFYLHHYLIGLEYGVYLDQHRSFDVDYPFPSEHYDTLLILSAKYGCSLLAQKLIGLGANLKATGEMDFTALHCAAMSNNGTIVSFLIDIGAELDAEMFDGNTPLHLTAMNGCDSAARILTVKGANVNARNEQGLTPFHLAIANGHKNLVKMFLGVSSLDISGWRQYLPTPLNEDELKKATAIEKLLLGVEKYGRQYALPPLVPVATRVPTVLGPGLYNASTSTNTLAPQPPLKRKLQENIRRYMKPKPAAAKPNTSLFSKKIPVVQHKIEVIEISSCESDEHSKIRQVKR